MQESLEERFNKLQGKHPNWNSYLCFANAIANRKYSKVKKWFNKLVDKDDYAPEDKKEILEFLLNLNSGKV